MKVHNTELVEALVDNQLKGFKRWMIQRHVGHCPTCARTYRRHLRVRQLLKANPVMPEMDDSAEFFWSKVKNDIESQSWMRRAFRSRVPDPQLREWLWRPAAATSLALAALVILGGIFWLMQENKPTVRPMQQVQAPVAPAPQPAPAPVMAHVPKPASRFAQVESVNTMLPHTVATSFESKDDGVTVIWVSGLPWTKDLTELQTLFANPGNLDT